MIIAQISDTHIEEPGNRAYGRYDTTAALTRALNALLALDRRPDLVVHTGDLAHSASAERYRVFREVLGSFPIPFCAIPGNHDARDPFRDAFADMAWMPRTGRFIQFVVDGPVRLVALDSTIPGAPAGELCAERLAWLADRLAEAPTAPTIVAMHHPPFATGMTGASSIGLVSGGRELDALLRRHPQVQRIIVGHNHRAMTAGFGGTIGYAAPSVSYPFALEMGPERLLSIAGEPPGFAVHIWGDDAGIGTPGLVTHTVPLGDWPAPIPLLKAGQRLIAPH
jgi:3',5'-cyclic AMP phosphodiesterase CpdA